ncbi:hypothetical protein MIND_00970000 [Mycena indigotica]|uniref:Ubiquitin 3 binding protein But2 C-terminal domain-containing protein n=1 Tax=Mycena indigotica TaxID=2126181 RepID=A0A8H6SD65_9AGAR|nr:uncharacterized protein MIND_00970000 [Mycena indigotica]KAF7297365.1 hypothetical protein MIND_00970000 [Mycena indigotica]
MSFYTPLPQDEELDKPRDSIILCECKQTKSDGSYWTGKPARWAVLAFIASITCTLLNLSFLLLQKENLSNNIKSSRIRLENPSSYIGLDKVVHNTTSPPVPPKPISAWPDFAEQIAESSPSMVLHQVDRHFTYFGTAYPTDRKFRIALDVSTVVQFRVRDFGMEKCTLTLSMGIAPPPTSGHHHGRSLSESAMATGSIDVWQLDQAHRLDPEHLSWNNRPSRRHLFATWDLAEMQGQPTASFRTTEFLCPSTEILTFELACAAGNPSCHLEFAQPREQPHSALFLIQRSSLY